MPARSGSKSIPRKNLVPLAGRPLLDYGLRAAQTSQRLERIFVSTDDPEIAARARALGVEVAERSPELATDEARVDDVARAFLAAFDTAEQPDVVVLIQPTSPFLLPEHVGELLDALAQRPQAASIHNAARVAHNHHAWNQRLLRSDGRVTFLFAKERQRSRNKQEKPRLHVFGNLIAARSAPLRAGLGFYADPAYAIEITPPWDFDVDGPDDLRLAELLLNAGQVRLPHLGEALDFSHRPKRT